MRSLRAKKQLEKPQVEEKKPVKKQIKEIAKRKDKPRWWNQRKANRPLSRAEIIPETLKLDKELAQQRNLPPLFHGNTPANTVIESLRQDKYFVRIDIPGHTKQHFKLAFETGNFESALKNYNEWTQKLTTLDWPYFFGDRKAIEKAETFQLLQDSENKLEEIKDEKEVERRSESPQKVPDIKETDIITPKKRRKSPKKSTPKKQKNNDLQLDDLFPEILQESDRLELDGLPSLSLTPQKGIFKDFNASLEQDFNYLQKEPEFTVFTNDILSVQDQLLDPTSLTPEFIDPACLTPEFIDPACLTPEELVPNVDETNIFKKPKEYIIPNNFGDLFEIKQSLIPNAGNGLFAKRTIPKSTFLGFYFGVPMTEDEFDSLKEGKGQASVYSHRYRNTVLDATNDDGTLYTKKDGVDCPFYYINERKGHVNVQFVEGIVVNQIICNTIKKIERGQELFVDYGVDVDRFWER
ncbi:hypothetical protein HDV01_006988 [Terramyces sp. JEL0728]|nr:hypothetical protein HDV01_006988 [Terramyces sp. JEL0728]